MALDMHTDKVYNGVNSLTHEPLLNSCTTNSWLEYFVEEDMSRSRSEYMCEDMNLNSQLGNMTPEEKERRGEEEEKCLIFLMRNQDPAGLRVLM